MTHDLFDKKTKKDKLIDWAMSKTFIKTSDVLKWGLQNYHNRAVRDLQDFAEKNPGKIVRISEEKKLRHFGLIKEHVWEVLYKD